jgi:ferredoxin
MLYIDPTKCIDCEACVAECPVSAIFLDENVSEKWRNYIELNAQMAPLFPSITEKEKKGGV